MPLNLCQLSGSRARWVPSARGEESSENSPYLQGGFENRKSKKIIESGLLEDPNLSRDTFESVSELALTRVCVRLVIRSHEVSSGTEAGAPQEVRAAPCVHGWGRSRRSPWFGRVLS